MEALIQDVRFAVRSLRKQRGLTAIALLCLALGIGANTAIFSVVRAVLLDPLPYREPDRLVRLYETFTAQGTTGRTGSVSVPNLRDWREQTRSFDAMLAYSGTGVNLQGGTGNPERLQGQYVSANAFSVLGAVPLAGRVFREGEDEAGALRVVVISEGLWRRRFGARREAIDSVVTLDGAPATVIGVMPQAFDLPIGTAHDDFWLPLVFADNPDSRNRGSHWLSVIARLKPGLTVDAAARDLAAATAAIALADPSPMDGRGSLVRPLTEVVVGDVRQTLWTLVGAVLLVLGIACADVASLLLARAGARRKEVAIRTALGADAGRIVRQLLVESVVLALAGGALGLLVATVSLRAILAYAASALPRVASVSLDGPVLAFAAGISVVTGIAFGLVPALRAARADVRGDLHESSGKASGGARQRRLLKGLVVAELAVSLVLVVGAGLLIRSFATLTDTPSGMATSGVLTFRTRVAQVGYDSTTYRRFYGPVLERIRVMPGVRSAGIISLLPIQSTGWNGNFQILTHPEVKEPSRQPFGEFRVAGSAYFATMGIPVRKGREFDDRDLPGSLPVLMINEEFAHRYFPGEDPVGQRMRAWSSTEYTIVGVAGDVRQYGLDQAPRAEIYVNAAQNPQRLGTMSFVIASNGKPTTLVPAVRAAIVAVLPDQPIFTVQTMDDVIGSSLERRKLTLVLLGALAALALILAAAGIFGVMAYTVSQRTRELGIRMALGASGPAVTRMVLGDAARMAGLAVAIGLATSLAVASAVRTLLYGIGPRDPATFVVAVVFVPAVAIASSLIPARRAARSDPLTAIRAE